MAEEIRADGIVIKKIPREEKGFISVIFTKCRGKITVISKGTEKTNSKMRPSLEVFSSGRYRLIRTGGDRAYYRLAGAESCGSFVNITSSLKRLGSAYVIAELADLFMQPEDAAEDVFEIIKSSLIAIDSCAESCIDAEENRFKILMLKACGYDIASDTEFLNSGLLGGAENGFLQSVSANELRAPYGSVSHKKLCEAVDSYLAEVLGKAVNSARFRAGLL